MDHRKTWKDRPRKERLSVSSRPWKRPKPGTTAPYTVRCANTASREQFTEPSWSPECRIFARNESWVPHISLVFREMWDSTNLDNFFPSNPKNQSVCIRGIPHLAKNERDV